MLSTAFSILIVKLKLLLFFGMVLMLSKSTQKKVNVSYDMNDARFQQRLNEKVNNSKTIILVIVIDMAAIIIV